MVCRQPVMIITGKHSGLKNDVEKTSATSLIILGLRKLKYFRKPGVVFWTLFWLVFYGIGSTVKQVTIKPEDLAGWINIAMVAVFGLEFCTAPIAVFIIHEEIPNMLARKNLKYPHRLTLFLAPLVINLVMQILMVGKAIEGFIQTKSSILTATGYVFKETVNAFGIIICMSLCNFILGVFVSNFIHDCKTDENNRSSHSTKEWAEAKLCSYAAIQNASQFALFTQFTINTLTIILLGCLLTVSGTCLNYTFSIIFLYSISLVICTLILCHLGMIMDDCFVAFQGIKTKVREAFVKTGDIQEAKEMLALIQRIEEQAPFSALGFFTVDRTTLMAEVGTILTYFVVLVQADLCPSTAATTIPQDNAFNNTHLQ